jgi:hypothetical protein
MNIAFVATECEEIIDMDWLIANKQMKGNGFMNARNCLNESLLKSLGFVYMGFARP